MFRNFIAIGLLFATTQLVAQEEVKCFIMPKANIKTKFSAEHLDGSVYFCCRRCVKKFEGAPENYTVQANYQLVLTGQYVQSGCPCTGSEVDDSFKLRVGETDVKFCGGDCMNKVKNAEDEEEMMKLIFSKENFAKAFRKKEEEIDLSNAKCLLMPDQKASREFWVEYMNSKLFFCCEQCKNDFEKKKNDEEIMMRINEQLFSTGQYRQRLCPLSHKPIDGIDNVVDINGNRIRMCSEIHDADLKALDDSEGRARVFNDENFKKSFEKKKIEK